jgi:CHAT domain-containing protein/Tfp pilus assembly protein PilF
MRFAPKVYGCAISLTLALPGSIAIATSLAETALAQVENASPADRLEVNGVLDADTDTLDNGEYYNVHTFEGTEGQDVVIEMISEAFDTYLIVLDPEGNRVAENDDGDGSNARVRLTLPATGTYRVWATSYGAGEVGRYRLSWGEDTALAELQQALEVARASGDREAELEALLNLASFYQNNDSYAEALEQFEVMLNLAQSVGDTDYELYSYLARSSVYDSIGVEKNSQAFELYNAGEVSSALESGKQGLAAAEQSVQIAQQGLDRAKEVGSEAFVHHLTLAVPQALVTVAQSHQIVSRSLQTQARSLIAEQDYRQAESLELESIIAAEKALEAAQEALALTKDSEAINSSFMLNLVAAMTAVPQSYDLIGSAYYGVRALRLQNEGLFEEQIVALQQALAAYEASLPLSRESDRLFIDNESALRDRGLSFGSHTRITSEKNALAGIINIYQSLSDAYGELERYSEGIAAAEKALEFSRQLPSRNSELTALGNLSNLYDSWGEQYLEVEEYDEALAAYEQSVFYAKEELKVAQSFIQSPQLSEFEFDYVEKGIDVVGEAPISIYNAYAGMRWVYYAQRDYESALAISQKLLEIAQQIENPIFEDTVLQGLYVDYDRLSRYHEALAVTRQRLELARQSNSPERELSAVITIASIQQDLGDYPEAVAAYKESFSVAQEQENLQRQITSLLNLGVIFGNQGDYNESLEYFEEALEINRNIRQRLEVTDDAETLEEACGRKVRTGQEFYELFGGEPIPELSGSNERRDVEIRESSRQGCIEVTWNTESKILGSIAANYSARGQYAEALSLNKHSLEIIQTYTNDLARESEATGAIGATYGDMGEYPIALDYAKRALVSATESNYQPSIALALTNLGHHYYLQGDYLKSLESYRSALKIVQDAGLKPDETDLLNRVGQVYYSRGLYDEAVEVLQQALDLSMQINHRSDQAFTLSTLSVVEIDRGRYAQALDYAEESLTILREIGAQPPQADLLVLVGRIRGIQGNYAAAIEAQHQALEIVTDLGDLDGEAYARQQLGLTYSRMGQYDRALRLNQEALEIVQRIGDRSREASTLDEIGNLYRQQGEYEQALQHYVQALAIWQAIDSPVGEARSLRNAGFVKEQLGHYGEAQADFQQSLALQRQIGARGHEGLTLNGLALAYAAQDETTEALSALQQALTLHRELGDRPGQAKALSDLGNVYLQANRLTEAEATLYEALDVLESLGASELKDTDKIALFDTQLEAYDTLQQVLVAQNNPTKTLTALEVAERGRARAFVDSLTVRLADTSDIPGDITFPDLANIRQIARQQNATLVEYAIVKANTEQPELYIWVVSPTGDIRFRQQSLQGIDLAALVQSTRSSLGVRSRATIAVEYSGPTTEEQLQELHQLLIAPIADLLPTDPEQRVIMIPQGDLFLVPFPALLNEQGQHLIEQHTLLTSPAIQVLDLTRQRRQQLSATRQEKSPLADVLIVGNPEMPTVRIPSIDWEGQLDPLPGALTEAQEIAAFFNTQAITGSVATEERIKQQMATPQILHLATHGLLEYGFPGESEVRDLPGAIALTPGNGEDGLLTAAEIYDMNLNAELVVLSACDTGRGRITGDGVVGLSRAFISAGTPSVVVSLWSVPDAPTADLMVAFYEQLQQGQDKAQALRQAMLQVMAQPGNEAPKNWAAFTLIGEAD